MTEACALCGNDVVQIPGLGARCGQCGLAPIHESSAELTLVRRAKNGELAAAERPIQLTPEFRAAYRLLRVLGSGSMGLVVEGRSRQDERAVAIKFCVALDADGLARFVREGSILATLKHPNIVPVLDVGYLRDNPYMVTEYMPGGTLRARLTKERKVPPAQAVAIARDILSGLAACHARSIVHRDIKPPNILFGADGSARIADLGIARELLSETELTHTGVILGTPRYMSPEQASGDKAGPASDLYAVGLVLYEMLAGKLPFEAENLFQLIQKQITQPPPPLAAIDPALPPALCALVHRTLAKTAEERPADAQELIRLLDAVYAPGAAAAAEPSLSGGPASKGERRRRPRTATARSGITPVAPPARRTRAVLAGAVATALVTLAVLAVVFPRPGPNVTEATPATASAGTAAPASASPASPASAPPPPGSPRPAPASPAASRAPPPRVVPSPRAAQSPHPAASPRVILSASPSPAPSPAPSPSASAAMEPVASPSAAPVLPTSTAGSFDPSCPFLLPPSARFQIAYQPHAGLGPPTALAPSPAGDRLAVGWESGHVTLFDRTGNIVANPDPPWPREVPPFTPITFLRFSRDGRFLAIGWSAVERWSVCAVPVAGAPLPRGAIGSTTTSLLAVGITDDGQPLAADAAPERVTLRPAGVTVLTGTLAGVSAAFTADGRRAAVASRTRGLECWDLAPARRSSVSTATDLSGCLSLNGNGDVVIAGLIGDRVRMVGFADGQTLSESDGFACPLAQTPPRDVFVNRSDRPGCLEVDAPGKLSHTALVAARAPAVFSNDGAFVAMGSWRGGVDIWETKPLLEVLEYHGNSLNVPVSPGLWWRRLEPRGIAGTPALCAPASGPGVTHLHQPAVQSVAVSEKGDQLAMLGESGTLEVRTLPEGKPVRRIDSPVIGGRFGMVRLVGEGRIALVVPPRPVDLLGFALAPGADASAVVVYSLENGRPLATLRGHTKPITDVAPSPDGKRFATAGADETVRLWNLDAMGPHRMLTGRASGAFRSVSWSPDGSRVVAQAGVTERSCVWHTIDGELEGSLVHTGILRGASYFATDHQVLLVGRQAASVAQLPGATENPSSTRSSATVFWERRTDRDATSTEPVESAPLAVAPPNLGFISSALSEDRDTLALGLNDGRIWIVTHVASRLAHAREPAPAPRELVLSPDIAETLALSSEGRWLVAGGARTVVYDLKPPAPGPAPGVSPTR